MNDIGGALETDPLAPALLADTAPPVCCSQAAPTAG